jgi:hypothetical protein
MGRRNSSSGVVDRCFAQLGTMVHIIDYSCSTVAVPVHKSQESERAEDREAGGSRTRDGVGGTDQVRVRRGRQQCGLGLGHLRWHTDLVHHSAAMVAKVGGVRIWTLRHPHLIQPYLAYYEHLASQHGGPWCSPIPWWCD